MTKRLNRWLLAIVLIIGLPTYWLLIDNRPGNAEAKPVSIGQLRSLAASKPGNPPEAIRFEAVGRTLRMRNLSAAGSGLRLSRIFALVFKIEFPGQPAIIIGSGLSRKQANTLNFSVHDNKSQARVNAAMKRARYVVTLGRELTQTGGLRTLKESEGSDSLPALVESDVNSRPENRPYALATGVVVIPTHGRITGTRLVYVRLASGREYLFAGNLSRTNTNWQELRVPARIITDFVQPEDRQEAFAWLLTLRKLKHQAPKLVIVSGNKIPKKAGLKRYFRSEPQE